MSLATTCCIRCKLPATARRKTQFTGGGPLSHRVLRRSECGRALHLLALHRMARDATRASRASASKIKRLNSSTGSQQLDRRRCRPCRCLSDSVALVDLLNSVDLLNTGHSVDINICTRTVRRYMTASTRTLRPATTALLLLPVLLLTAAVVCAHAALRALLHRLNSRRGRASSTCCVAHLTSNAKRGCAD